MLGTLVSQSLDFEEQKDLAKCNLCRRPFVYRCGCTSSLRKHLKAKHAGSLLPLVRYMNFKDSCASESQKNREDIDFVIFYRITFINLFTLTT